jgi:hypothetical protein
MTNKDMKLPDTGSNTIAPLSIVDITIDKNDMYINEY